MTKIPPRSGIGDTSMNRRTASQLMVAAFSAAMLPFSTIARAKAGAERIAAMMKPGPLGDRVLGRGDAPSVIIEYASFTCPHCARFHADVLPELKKKYISTGKTKLIYRDFPLDDLALIVALLARCIKGDAYFDFINVLYKQQRAWAAAPKDRLLELMKEAGVGETGFDKCITNQEVLNAVRWERERASKEFDVNSTPTIFVSGEKIPANFEKVSAALDAEIAAAS